MHTRLCFLSLRQTPSLRPLSPSLFLSHVLSRTLLTARSSFSSGLLSLRFYAPFLLLAHFSMRRRVYVAESANGGVNSACSRFQPSAIAEHSAERAYGRPVVVVVVVIAALSFLLRRSGNLRRRAFVGALLRIIFPRRTPGIREGAGIFALPCVIRRIRRDFLRFSPLFGCTLRKSFIEYYKSLLRKRASFATFYDET